ncbi:hypothetical protein [Sulfurimonas sp.]
MKYLTLLFIIFFSACSIKNYEHTDTKIVIIKSPKIKFSDIGYVKHTDSDIELELFIAGHVFQKIDINHMICMNEGCMSKGSFNEDYLVSSYPSSILQNIILGNKIYDGKNLLKNEDGFEQIIQNSNVNIKYKVNAHEIFFKDRKNHIIIKIKDIQ